MSFSVDGKRQYLCTDTHTSKLKLFYESYVSLDGYEYLECYVLLANRI